MTGRVKDMKVGREKDYLGDRVVLTCMPCGAVTGHQLSKLSRRKYLTLAFIWS